jgi:acyl-CoA synthetase (AMP-forming)/AMP-acid ligase II
LHAQVELRTAAAGIDPEELIAYCRSRLSAYRVPHSIEVVEQIATTSSEKIRRGSL